MDAKETFDQFLTLFYLHPTSVWEEPDPDAATAFIPLDNGEHAWLVMPHEDDFHSQIGYDRWFATRNMDGSIEFFGINEDGFEIAFRHVKATADRKQKEFVDRYHLKGYDNHQIIKGTDHV